MVGEEGRGDRTSSEAWMKGHGTGENLWEEMVGNRVSGGFGKLKQLCRDKNGF